MSGKTDLLLPEVSSVSCGLLNSITKTLGIPRDILASEEDINYAWQDLPRELSKIPPQYRDDLIAKTQSEIDILMAYLPEQLTEEEVDKIIDEIFADVQPTGPKDMGKVMKEATAKLKGKADMKSVSTKIREKLN